LLLVRSRVNEAALAASAKLSSRAWCHLLLCE
jgi:hypothetical protein